MRAAGFSLAKIAAIKDLAKKTLEGVVPERAILVDLDDAAIIERITQVRGIGRWTVEIMLMFQLGPRVLAAFGERWKPHRTAAAWYLWRAVDLSRAGKLPAPTERIRLPRVKRKKARRRSARKKSVSAG